MALHRVSENQPNIAMGEMKIIWSEPQASEDGKCVYIPLYWPNQHQDNLQNMLKIIKMYYYFSFIWYQTDLYCSRKQRFTVGQMFKSTKWVSYLCANYMYSVNSLLYQLTFKIFINECNDSAFVVINLSVRLVLQTVTMHLSGRGGTCFLSTILWQ